MKLDKNENENGRGKYALINLRTNKIEWGDNEEDEFFVIKLKDVNAGPALREYAKSIREFDEEFADEVILLAEKAEKHPTTRQPN